MSEADEALKEFLIECQENLARVDLELLELEKSTDPELVKSIFRVMHTIKGSAGFLGLGRLEKLTHAGENLLSIIRDGKLKPTQQITTTLLDVVEGVRNILASLEATASEGSYPIEPLLEQLKILAEGGVLPVAAPPPGGVPSAQTILFPLEATLICESPRLPEKRPNAPTEVIAPTAAVPSPFPSAPLPPVAAAVPSPVMAAAEPPRDIPGSIADSSVRISVDVLDKLMSLASELVLSRNQLLQCSERLNDAPLLAASRQFNNVTSELQEALMKTRMQPIANIWNKFPRMVREVAAKLGKQISLEMEGADTELDKSLIEAIKDPLTHLVRNSIDHGIESPEARTHAGKQPGGRLLLRAYHESGQVNIVISDDGGGIDLDKIRAKALEKQLLGADELARVNENAVLQLIFLPGFSTAEKVSNLSGRGVGMDVVKNNIEKIGGMVDLQSAKGAGTTIHLRIPLTLAIIRALTISSGGQVFAVPQAHITELIRLSGDRKHNSIEFIHDIPVIRFRGRLLPLIDLGKLLGLDSEGAPEPNHLLVLQAEDKSFGLLVNGVRDTNEIVVKPLPNRLKGLNCFAGVTITGEGSVQLILDISGLARAGKVLPKIRELGVKLQSSPNDTAPTQQKNGEGLLLISIGKEGQIAVPLEQVARLEEFKPNQIEIAGSRALVQYRGEILPLHSLAGLLSGKDLPWNLETTGMIPVVVHRQGAKLVGLTVDKILDTVYEAITVTGESDRRGIRRTAVVQGRITGYVDLNLLMNQSPAGPGGVL